MKRRQAKAEVGRNMGDARLATERGTTVNYKKLDTSLQPFVITSTHSPGELHEWKEQFGKFYKKSSLAKEEPSIQSTYFAQSVDLALLRSLKEGADSDTPIYGEGGLMARLDNKFEVFVRMKDEIDPTSARWRRH